MKKQEFLPFLLLFALFLCICLGLFAGRNLAVPEDAVLCPQTQPRTAFPAVDLNQADMGTLTSLPGIGPALARKILAYREAYGPFTSLAQLLRIEGIGESKLEALLPYITTGGS